MKNFKLLATTLTAIAATSFASAIALPEINGEIHIVADNSYANVDMGANSVSFVNMGGPSDDMNARVSLAMGDYNGLYGVDANYSDIFYDPFVEQTVWSIDSDTYFVLERLTSVSEEAGSLDLTGWGTAYHDSYAATGGAWSFSADLSGTVFSFSSTTSVPDTGSSALLLGLGLVGLAAATRRFKK